MEEKPKVSKEEMERCIEEGVKRIMEIFLKHFGPFDKERKEKAERTVREILEESYEDVYEIID